MTEVVWWRLISKGRPVGDFPEVQIAQLAAAGRINPDDLLWRPGMSRALPARGIEPFGQYFRGSYLGDDPAMRWVLPVGRSPWAIASGYLGLFSVLLVFGPFAVLTGLLALRHIERTPGLHGRGRAIFGITAGTVGSLVLLIVASLRR